MNWWELVRINENQGLDLFDNQRKSIPDIFKNQWESAGIILRIRENHQELARNFENEWESVRINENQGLDLFDNQFETYLRIIENNQGLARISKNQWESGLRLIQESTLILIDFCSFSMILADSWWFSNKSEIESSWFLNKS